MGFINQLVGMYYSAENKVHCILQKTKNENNTVLSGKMYKVVTMSSLIKYKSKNTNKNKNKTKSLDLLHPKLKSL